MLVIAPLVLVCLLASFVAPLVMADCAGRPRR